MFPMMFPCVPTPDKCSKNFSHDICFAKQEVGKGTRSKEWRLCAGLGFRVVKRKSQGACGQREREREREVCNAFTPKTNKSWDDDHADDKKLLRTSSTRSMSLPAGNCGGGGYDELLDYAHKHRSMLAPMRQCNASAHPV